MSVEATTTLQICSGRGKSWRRRGQVGSNGSEDHARCPREIVIRDDRDLEPIRCTAPQGHAVLFLQLLSPLSNHRLRQPHVTRPFAVEVRDLTLADPKRRARCKRSFANGYAIGEFAASFEELELPVGHFTIFRCGTGSCHLSPAPGRGDQRLDAMRDDRRSVIPR